LTSEGGEETRARRTLTFSIIEGLGYSVMVGAGESYFIPYAIFLGGSNLILGLFVALPIFAGSMTQLFTEQLLRLLGSRKRVIATGVFLQILTFVPIIALPELASSGRPEILLFLACVYWACGLLVTPSWSSLMGDLVPEDRRGVYFARRNRYVQITTFTAMVGAGLVLYFSKQSYAEMEGFVTIFLVAGAARVVSLLFLLAHWEPPLQSPPPRRDVPALVETLRNPDQRVLVLYLTLMNFSVYLAAPFFSAFMLRSADAHGLDWSYMRYTLVNGITVLFKFFFLPVWGAASDRYGSRKCLVLAAWLVCFLPLFWLFPRGEMSLYFAVICMAQTWGGFAWAGHELCSFNFLLDSAHASERPRLVAAMNTLNGVMVFAGSLCGSIIVLLAPAGANPFLLVFAASSASRLAVCAALVRRLREVRLVEKISYRALLFRVSSIRAQLGPVMRFFVLPAKRR
jgi:MFS family permease